MLSSCSVSNRLVGVCLGLLVLLPVVGCGPSESIPPSELRHRITTMSTDDLLSLTREYRDACLECRQQMAKVRAKIKANPQGPRITTLSKKASEITRRMGKLDARYRICFDALSHRGVNVEDLKID